MGESSAAEWNSAGRPPFRSASFSQVSPWPQDLPHEDEQVDVTADGKYVMSPHWEAEDSLRLPAVPEKPRIPQPPGDWCGDEVEESRVEASHVPSRDTTSPPRRFNKKPLRGPYGQMLEVQMSKLGRFPPERMKDEETPRRAEENVRVRKVGLGSPFDELSGGRGRSVEGSEWLGVGEGATHQRTLSSPSQLGLTNSTRRRHVVAELVGTEESYVEALRCLVHKYMEPLKSLLDPGLVNDIFFGLPSILAHHEALLAALKPLLLDEADAIGAVLLRAFADPGLLEAYSAFVHNWRNAQGCLKLAVASKPGLARFLEGRAREHAGKLSLDSLLIMPVQRIPRYELLLKELLKEGGLGAGPALERVKDFAARVNRVDPPPVDVEGLPPGLGHLIREDVVRVGGGRKERALLLFADSLVIAAFKRKPQTRKPGGLEGVRLKLVSRSPLGDINIVGGPGSESRDAYTIQMLSELASRLSIAHGALDEAIKELHSVVGLDGPDYIDLQMRSDDGDWEVLRIEFGSSERRDSWLETFTATHGKFVKYGFVGAAPVQFIQALPIRKTRAGLQLSCAAAVSLCERTRRRESSDVWVANSDGYVGQVCILTLQPEPAVTSCNGVCNSRINCILSVPPGPPAVVAGAAGTWADEAGGEWTVWLGTEDGGLLVYECSDSVRVKKSRHKINVAVSITSLAFFKGKVVAGFGTGLLAVYRRNDSEWVLSEPKYYKMMDEGNAVVRLVSSTQLWAAAGDRVEVWSEESEELISSASLNVHENVADLVVGEEMVWISTEASATIHSFHSKTFEKLLDLSFADIVYKTLSGSEEIIRQIKSACLRVTALLLGPDTSLWVGTSAGVILYLQRPHARKQLDESVRAEVTALSHGHTGQVRFLTAVRGRDGWMVISGGDGYEEFRPLVSSDSTDVSGREDSTNHLLLWRVPPPVNCTKPSLAPMSVNLLNSPKE